MTSSTNRAPPHHAQSYLGPERLISDMAHFLNKVALDGLIDIPKKNKNEFFSYEKKTIICILHGRINLKNRDFKRAVRASRMVNFLNTLKPSTLYLYSGL